MKDQLFHKACVCVFNTSILHLYKYLYTHTHDINISCKLLHLHQQDRFFTNGTCESPAGLGSPTAFQEMFQISQVGSPWI